MNSAPSLRMLCIGDIVGRPGREIVKRLVPELRIKEKLDLVIANAENAAGGLGPAPRELAELQGAGVDLFTLGDHTWQQKEMEPFLSKNPNFCVRPANYPEPTPGLRSIVYELNGKKIGLFSLLGRVFSNNPLDCPFKVADAILENDLKDCQFILCDIHAEASSEKAALAHYLDGRVSFIFGTHTHVPTADARILPKGSGFVTDLGMCGPAQSVIGMNIEQAIKRFTTGVGARYKLAESVAGVEDSFGGVVVEVAAQSGKCIALFRV